MQGESQEQQTSSSSISLNEARDILRVFAKERNWEQFHTPRNLMLALVGEVGQLSQIFQWKGELPVGLEGMSQSQKVHLGEEMADVFNYLIRLADVCNVDLNKAYLDKMEKNRKKYPAELVKGSAKKYIEYKQEHRRANFQANAQKQEN